MTTSDLDPDALEMAWEFFCDPSYYDFWAVRPVGDRDFNSQRLFHVASELEAKHLVAYLTAREPGVTGKGEGE